MRINEGVQVAERKIEIPTFETVPLPPDAVRIEDITEFTKFSIAVVEYMAARNLHLDDTDYYWSPSLAYRDRLIIPFYFEKRIVGWTARTITADKKPKYLNDQQAGFVYGLDNQTWPQDINDVGDAVDKYGRLYALYSIASAAETSPLKIRLRAKKWFV